MWIIPGLVQVKSFAAYELIAPAVGIKLWRVKGRDRPRVPEPTKRLIRMAPFGNYKLAVVINLLEQSIAPHRKHAISHIASWYGINTTLRYFII